MSGRAASGVFESSDSSDDDDETRAAALGATGLAGLALGQANELDTFGDARHGVWRCFAPAAGVGANGSIVSAAELDARGVLHWMGTEGDRHGAVWRNPAISSSSSSSSSSIVSSDAPFAVRVHFAPQLQSDSQPAIAVCGRTACRLVTKAGTKVRCLLVLLAHPVWRVNQHSTPTAASIALHRFVFIFPDCTLCVASLFFFFLWPGHATSADE